MIIKIASDKKIIVVLNDNCKISFTPTELLRLKSDKFKELINTIGGPGFVKRLQEYSKFKPLSTINFGSFKEKIGAGKCASVYQYNGASNIVAKIIPRTRDKTCTFKYESKIMDVLKHEILYNIYTPCIMYNYQYLITSKYEYLLIEKMDINLGEYINKNKPTVNVLKAIIFQVLFTLAVLQTKLPGFRHNDLKLDNILLDLTVRTAPTTLKFKKLYYKIAPNVPLVKIADLDFANIPDHVTNYKVTTRFSKTFGCTPEKNNIYDVHLFLNSCSLNVNTPSEINNFILSQIPKQLFGIKNEHLRYGRLINPQKWVKKIKEPHELIMDPFFKSLKIKQPTNIIWGI